MNPSSSKFTTRGKVESGPKLPIQVSLQRGLATEESKAPLPMSRLWLFIAAAAAAEFHWSAQEMRTGVWTSSFF